ncbi:MAG: hypothetical protein IKU57_02135 [Oscillospiraceae bacterium]|nr:hypothetical protein [Oscillospiraceae bacterium]
MKELYIAPELNVICFAPVERLAADGEINFDDLLDAGGLKPEASRDPEGDLDLDL